MKKIIIGCTVAAALLSALAGCNEQVTTYNGPSYITFSDTLYQIPVQEDGEYYDVPVVATQPCDYDRTVAVEVIDQYSNAIEGKHYDLESNTVTIKAGERVANVKVRGYYDNIEPTDSLGFALRLITDEDSHWGMYGIDTKAVLTKVCPFTPETFTGYCVVTSTYLLNYAGSYQRLARSVMDEEDPDGKTIILKDLFYDGYDIKVKLDTKDPLNPLIEMEDDQIMASTALAFGTIYGDGNLRMDPPAAYVSYYSTCEKFIFLYMTAYVLNKDGSAYGTVGTFVNAIEWISDDEAEKLKREGL